MKKLSEYRNGEAIDLLVDILEPATEMMTDKEVIEKLYSSDQRMEGVKLMLKNHKSAVIKILAALDGVSEQEYDFGFFMLPTRLLEVLNDKELLAFFTAQQMNSTEIASASAMENSEEHGN